MIKKIIIFYFLILYISFSSEFEEYNLELKKILIENKNISLAKNQNLYFKNIFEKLDNIQIKINNLINQNFISLISAGNVEAKLIKSDNIKNVKIRYKLNNSYIKPINIYVEQEKEEIIFVIKINFTFIKL
jgi:hypothetical protein